MARELSEMGGHRSKNETTIAMTQTKGHFNYELCAACKGKCCTKTPGLYLPEDFKEELTPEFIVKLLDTGKISIDYYIGDPKEDIYTSIAMDDFADRYYLRPRITDGPAINGSSLGTCINWTKEKGCSLTEDERPYQCRMLKPSVDSDGLHDCTYLPGEKTKREVIIEWLPYQEVLNKAIELYYKKQPAEEIE